MRKAREHAVAGNQSLSVERIRHALPGQTVGRQIHLFDEVPSTNSTLVRLARAGAREGTVVLAEGQTAGRGRLGQVWYSPPGVNLYASVLFRPPIAPREIPVFSFIASLALADVIQEEGAEPAIKWPNDVLVERKKAAGVLAASAAAGDRVEFVVLGVGVNLNVERLALASALGPAAGNATSLREVVGREIDRNAFAARFLMLLDEWFQLYLSKSAAVVLQAWRDRDITTGRRVEVREETARFDGRAIGVDPEGDLVVRDSYGKVWRVASGEIRFLD